MHLHVGDLVSRKRRERLQSADLVGDHALDLVRAVAADDAPSEAPEIVEAGMRAEGDALLSVEGSQNAEVVAKLVRGTDRVLDTGTKLLLFLAGGGTEAIVAFLGRMHEEATGGTVRSIVVNEGESGGDAFSRLKSTN